MKCKRFRLSAQCNICGKVISRADRLKVHIDSVHRGKKQVKKSRKKLKPTEGEGGKSLLELAGPVLQLKNNNENMHLLNNIKDVPYNITSPTSPTENGNVNVKPQEEQKSLLEVTRPIQQLKNNNVDIKSPESPPSIPSENTELLKGHAIFGDILHTENKLKPQVVSEEDRYISQTVSSDFHHQMAYAYKSADFIFSQPQLFSLYPYSS